MNVFVLDWVWKNSGYKGSEIFQSKNPRGSQPNMPTVYDSGWHQSKATLMPNE